MYLRLSGKENKHGGRPRRYYQITEKGRQALASEMAGWQQILQAMIRFSGSRPAEV